MSDVSSLPIDIHCSKLLEWLESRRHCSKNWQKQALVVRSKISQAIQDMPEHPEILSMLSGAYINYFHCLRIAEILKTTESNTKNIFGRYSSQRVKDWQEILSLYEKDNLYLSECAQILQQCAQYEIPALKKQLAKCQTVDQVITSLYVTNIALVEVQDGLIQDYERKQVEYDKQIKECDRKFKENCDNMQIKGENLKRELLSLADDLPKRYESIVAKIVDLSPVVDFYEKYRKFTLNVGHRLEELKDVDLPKILTDLKYLIKNGNTTVFEWRKGFKPEKIERAVVIVDDDENNEKENDIDFGIDFGNEDSSSQEVIDFGGIEEVASGESDVKDSENLKDNIARLDEALTLLEYDKFLKVLDRDLREIQSFLFVRSLELTRQLSSADNYAVLDASLNLDSEQIHQYKSRIDHVLSILNDTTLKRTRQLRISPSYVEKLSEILYQPLKQKEKLSQMKLMARDKVDESKRLAQETKRKIDLLSQQSKELQKKLESDISRRYQNRPVNIIGSTVAIK